MFRYSKGENWLSSSRSHSVEKLKKSRTRKKNLFANCALGSELTGCIGRKRKGGQPPLPEGRGLRETDR